MPPAAIVFDAIEEAFSHSVGPSQAAHLSKGNSDVWSEQAIVVQRSVILILQPAPGDA